MRDRVPQAYRPPANPALAPPYAPPSSSCRRRPGVAARDDQLRRGHLADRVVGHRQHSPRTRWHPAGNVRSPRPRCDRTVRPYSRSNDSDRSPDTPDDHLHGFPPRRSEPRRGERPDALRSAPRPRDLARRPAALRPRSTPRARAARASSSDESTPPENATPSRCTSLSFSETAVTASSTVQSLVRLTGFVSKIVTAGSPLSSRIPRQ